MKKLATMFVALSFTGGVALACPHMDSAETESTPKTAEKDKKADDAKAKEQPKKEDAAKAKDNTKTAKPAETKDTAKKPDKVSAK